jgi:hypothetical protein
MLNENLSRRDVKKMRCMEETEHLEFDELRTL